MSLLSFLFGSSQQQSNSITILDNVYFKTAINGKKVQLIDVRTSKEYKAGHIAKSKNIDFFNQKEFINEFRKLEKDKAVYLYCRSGNRSQKAARKLDSLGFKEIYDLKGGYLNWE